MTESTRDDGGQAFPSSDVSSHNDRYGNNVISTERIDGMTLRDYFAATSLVAICASRVLESAANGVCDLQKRPQPDVFAELSYAFADAMLAERAK